MEARPRSETQPSTRKRHVAEKKKRANRRTRRIERRLGSYGGLVTRKPRSEPSVVSRYAAHAALTTGIGVEYTPSSCAKHGSQARLLRAACAVEPTLVEYARIDSAPKYRI